MSVNSLYGRGVEPDYFNDGTDLFGEVREAKPPIAPQILPSSPVLKGAIDGLFTEGNVFDTYANAHKMKYCMLLTVDVESKDGRVKTADLEKFGLSYSGESVSMQDLMNDRILVRRLDSDAVWKIHPSFPNSASILVRLDSDASKNSSDDLMARMAYGLYKFMWRNELARVPTTDWEKVGLERTKRDFKEAIEQTLNLHEVKARPKYDSEPSLTPTIQFIRAYIAYERNPQSTELQEVVEWGQDKVNRRRQDVKEAIAFVKRLGIFS